MNKRLTRTLLTTLLATSATLGISNVIAYEAGDLIVRAGAAGVFPTGDSETTPFAAGSKVEAHDAWSLGLTGTYMVGNNLGIGLLAAWPYHARY